MKTYTKAIIQRSEPMTDAQIASALKVSQTTEWWRAIVQLINNSREDYIERASGCADRNNPLGMARDTGAHELGTQLLIKLEELSLGGE